MLHRGMAVLLVFTLILLGFLIRWNEFKAMASITNKAEKLIEKGDIDGAMRLAQPVIKNPKAKSKDKSDAYRVVGRCCAAKQNHEAAKYYFTLADQEDIK